MFKSRFISLLTTSALLVTVLIAFNPIACSSSSTTTNPDGSTTLTVSNLGKDISLTTGEMKEISFPVNYNPEDFGGPFSPRNLYLQATI